MIEALTWCITAISMTGTVLNIRKNIACFYLWTVGNSAWLAYDLCSSLYSRAMLDAVQLPFAMWGIIAWRKKSPSA